MDCGLAQGVLLGRLTRTLHADHHLRGAMTRVCTCTCCIGSLGHVASSAVVSCGHLWRCARPLVVFIVISQLYIQQGWVAVIIFEQWVLAC